LSEQGQEKNCLGELGGTESEGKDRFPSRHRAKKRDGIGKVDNTHRLVGQKLKIPGGSRAAENFAGRKRIGTVERPNRAFKADMLRQTGVLKKNLHKKASVKG